MEGETGTLEMAASAREAEMEEVETRAGESSVEKERGG